MKSMIHRVSTIPVEVNSRLAAARLPLHVSKLPVESMEDLSCVFWCELAALFFRFFGVKTLNTPFLGGNKWKHHAHVIGRSSWYHTHISRLKMFAPEKMWHRRPDVWNNEASSDHHLPICPTFGLTCFDFFRSLRTRKMLHSGQLSEWSEELIQKTNGGKLRKKNSKLQTTLVQVSFCWKPKLL